MTLRIVRPTLVVAAAAGLVVSACSSTPPTDLHLLKDWSSVDALVVSDVSGQTVLSGIDTRHGRVDPLAVLPNAGDTRVNRSAQVIQDSKNTYVVVLPGAARQSGITYRVELATRRVTKQAVLPAALHLARLGHTFVGVGDDGVGNFVLHRYTADFKSSATVPLPLKPSYAGVDGGRASTCYAGGDGSQQQVAAYRLGRSTLTTTSFAMEGNTTGVTCSGGRVATALGDLPAEGTTTPANSSGRVSVRRQPGALGVTVLSTPTGSSGKIVFSGDRLLADIPAADGRELVSVDPITAQVDERVKLPAVGTVEAILPMGNQVLVVGSDNSYVVRDQGKSITHLAVVGDLFDMSIDLTAGAVSAG
jgi:hypothetical protein